MSKKSRIQKIIPISSLILATMISPGEAQTISKKSNSSSNYKTVNFKNESYKKILKIVREIVTEKLGVEFDKTKPEAKLKEDLGADSLDAVELIMEFEKEFNIPISDEIAENIKTVHDAVLVIQNAKKIKSK